MNEPKNIDRIFKERFKEFEAEPPINSWNSIQNNLEASKPAYKAESYSNKYLKLFHLTASCFFVAFTMGITDHLYTKYSTKDNEVNRLNELEKNNQEIISKLNQQQQQLKQQNNLLQSKLLAYQDSDVVKQKNSDKKYSQNYKQNNLAANNHLVSINNIPTKEIINQMDDIVFNEEINSPYMIVDESTGNIMDENDNLKVSNSKNKTTASILETTNGNRVLRIKSENSAENDLYNFQKNIINQSYIASIDSIKDKRVVLKVDSKNLSPDELKLINQISESDVDVEKGDFKITAKIAPNFIGLNQDKSYIDSQFDSNKKNTVMTLSYGIGLEYQLNNKFAIRSGIYKQDLEYKTLDVAYQTGASNSNIKNLNFTNQGLNTYIETDFNNASNLANTGAIKQSMTYLEIPLEIKYKLLESKLNLNVIGGFSTLFLTENEVYLSSNYLNTKIGELNNLNKINYSTNLGLNASYKITDNLDFEIEPMFKYQLNTTNNKNNNPYTFGLYTGVSYKF